MFCHSILSVGSRRGHVSYAVHFISCVKISNPSSNRFHDPGHVGSNNQRQLIVNESLPPALTDIDFPHPDAGSLDSHQYFIRFWLRFVHIFIVKLFGSAKLVNSDCFHSDTSAKSNPGRNGPLRHHRRPEKHLLPQHCLSRDAF
jgi:hypothetical protein